MTALRIVIGLGAAVFFGLVIYAFIDGARIEALFENPWGWVTVVDLYLGLGLIAVVVWLVEERLASKLVWILPLPFLGNGWAAIWLISKLPTLARRLSGRSAA